MSTNYATQAVLALLNCVSFSCKMHIFIHEVLGQIWYLDETFTLEIKWWNPNQMHFKCRYPYCRRASRWWKSWLNLLKECREDVKSVQVFKKFTAHFSTSQCQSHSRGKAQSQQINREQLRPCLSNFCWLVNSNLSKFMLLSFFQPKTLLISSLQNYLCTALLSKCWSLGRPTRSEYNFLSTPILLQGEKRNSDFSASLGIPPKSTTCSWDYFCMCLSSFLSCLNS